MRIRSGILVLLLCLLIILSFFSLFKHISYPLLWNDESETVMFGKRILEHGYPKVHGEKNVIYQIWHPEMGLGINEQTDAYIASGWLQYYFSTFGITLAYFTDDIYLKTALIRIPFAIIGILGLAIIALSITKLLNNKKSKLLFLIFFFLLELSSISLTLHLREARYYSLIIFLSSCLLYIYIRYNFLNNLNRKLYNFLLIILLILLFNTFYPVFFVFILIFFIHEFIKFGKKFYKKNNRKEIFIKLLESLFPLILSLFLVAPFIIFFEIVPISRALSIYRQFDLNTYFLNVTSILESFIKWEFLYFALILKVILIYGWINSWYKKSGTKYEQRIQLSNLLSFLFISYILIISRSPYYFERYYIIFQPILITIILLDLFILSELISRFNFSINKKRLIITLILILFAVGFLPRAEQIKGHLYELTHQYKGPLDYTIPYIKDNFTKPENLVIATNYEETSYMYYLNSKVIIGYVGNNLEADIKEQPDVIIYRKERTGNPRIFNYFLQQNNYKKITFPVYDYFVNNIAEPCCHLYKTLLAKNEYQQLTMFVKQSE